MEDDQHNCKQCASNGDSGCTGCKIRSFTSQDSNNNYERFGITTVGNDGITLTFQGDAGNRGQRLMGLHKSDDRYFNIPFGEPGFEEISFEVDVSDVKCTYNAAIYMVAMRTDTFDLANCGVGYADAQCPTDMQVNPDGTPGQPLGASTTWNCATEMDLMEVNREASAFTTHPCASSTNGGSVCRDNENDCKAKCDRPGCDWNPYRTASLTQNEVARNFYGYGSEFQINTERPFYVISSYDKATKTFRQRFEQDEKTLDFPPVTTNLGTPEQQTHEQLTDAYCAAWHDASSPDVPNQNQLLGGNCQMETVARQNDGLVLVISLWDDFNHDTGKGTNMAWLDSTFPQNSPNATDVRGRCPFAETPKDPVGVKATYRDFRFGKIGYTRST